MSSGKSDELRCWSLEQSGSSVVVCHSGDFEGSEFSSDEFLLLVDHRSKLVGELYATNQWSENRVNW